MKPCWPGNTHTHTGSGSTQVGFVHLLLRLPKQKARSSILEVLCHLHRNHGWPLGLVGRHVLTHANLHAPLANMIHKLKTSRAIDSCDLATRNMRAPLGTRSGLHRRLQLDPARLQTLSPPSLSSSSSRSAGERRPLRRLQSCGASQVSLSAGTPQE
jgi:hypothetical protein